ncbi:hypothetical protein HGRIS_006411 [Hohenbuehelia grisea]|uniref:NAD-dependent protein deacetylase n=1 Tax=Hohenbuehelia grisea TaxID=104357 RepID=A0ABR3K044_9AGAR
MASRRKVPKPKVLEGLDVESLAKYISSDKCKKIVLMLGAGVSTSAGIPDFRSPGTGLYANLARLNLPFPEAVFEINFFRRNPVPFYTLAKELYPGKFRPTPTHSFIKLLADHSLLHVCFTQNIDTLERRAGIPDDKIIEAHGSFAVQRCIDCKVLYDDDLMKEKVTAGEVATCEECGGYVKPDIVFFGEALPPQFIQTIPQVGEADLLIILGTSLTVHPFASLAEMAGRKCPRVLINLEGVGGIGSRPDDLLLLGKCDDIVRELCQALGWENKLEEEWEKTKDSVETHEPADETTDEPLADTSVEDSAKTEVEKLTRAIEEKLALETKAEEPASESKDPKTAELARDKSTSVEKSKGDDDSIVETTSPETSKGADSAVGPEKAVGGEESGKETKL